MNSAVEYLLLGFAFATRRPHLILIDLIAKLVWAGTTVVVFWSAGFWFAGRALLADADVRAFQSGSPVMAGAAFFHVLAENVETLTGSLIFAATASFTIWVVVESFARAGLLPLTGANFFHDALSHFGRFLFTGLVRRAILLTAMVLITLIGLGPLLAIPMTEWSRTWTDVRWPTVAGLAVLGLLAFSLTILETLVRSDAVDALGRELPNILGIVGTLVMIEGILFIAGAGTLMVTLEVAESGGAVLVVGVLVLGFLSVMHSYLLFVRYFAVGTMAKKMG